MGTRKSILTPIIVILAGVLFQLKALGVLGHVGDGLLEKLWPLLLMGVAVDLAFEYRRIFGAIIIGAASIALLCTQFLPSGWNSDIWKAFLSFWPILLIIYGFDILFSGQSFFNGVVIVLVIVIAVYALLAALDVPIMRKLPKIDLQGMNLPKPGSGVAVPRPPEPKAAEQNDGNVNYVLPEQYYAALDIDAASGKIQLKADSGTDSLLNGRISLSGSEVLYQSMDVYGQEARYSLQSSGSAESSGASEWNLAVSPYRSLSIDLSLTSGYLKADLRNLDLNQVLLENGHGPIDVMLPVVSEAQVEIIADSGNIRVYIPDGGAAEFGVYGAADVTVPQGYYEEDGTVSPYTWQQQPVSVIIRSNGGTVQIK